MNFHFQRQNQSIRPKLFLIFIINIEIVFNQQKLLIYMKDFNLKKIQ